MEGCCELRTPDIAAPRKGCRPGAPSAGSCLAGGIPGTRSSRPCPKSSPGRLRPGGRRARRYLCACRAFLPPPRRRAGARHGSDAGRAGFLQLPRLPEAALSPARLLRACSPR